MDRILKESSVFSKLRCPACKSECAIIPTSHNGNDCIHCPQCGYSIIWDASVCDARIEKNHPKDDFNQLLKNIGLSHSDLSRMKMLEIGFGHGKLLQELQKWSPMAYGIDLVKPLKSAQLRPGSAIFGDLFNIPLMPRQFDLVVCKGVIQHTNDPRKAFDCVAEQVAHGREQV